MDVSKLAEKNLSEWGGASSVTTVCFLRKPRLWPIQGKEAKEKPPPVLTHYVTLTLK
jgi:hypothetical protein